MQDAYRAVKAAARDSLIREDCDALDNRVASTHPGGGRSRVACPARFRLDIVAEPVTQYSGLDFSAERDQTEDTVFTRNPCRIAVRAPGMAGMRERGRWRLCPKSQAAIGRKEGKDQES